MKRTLILMLAAGLLSGCLDVQDELTINADGSGAVRMEVKVGAGANDYLNSGTSGSAASVQYPPVAVREARIFFPEPDFAVQTEASTGDMGERTLVINASFKDVNALLASPYGRVHALELKKDGDQLVIRGLPAIGGLAHVIEGARSDTQTAMYLELNSEMTGTKGLRAEFKVNLPNAISQSNGDADGRRVVWLADQNQTTNPAVFLGQTDRVIEARCAATGITFSPSAPVRLATRSFSELAPGAMGPAVTGPDPSEVLKAAKFIPHAMQVKRNVDLSGNGYVGDSEATLIGFVVLPAAFKPQRWGVPVLDEVLDAKGKSLKPADADDGMSYSRRYSSYDEFDFDEEEEDGESSNPAAAPAEERHVISFQFRSPDWNVKSVAKLKGSVALNYGGGLFLAKITNAVPASWIPAAGATGDPLGLGGSFSSDEDGARMLKSAELDGLEAKVICQSVTRQAGGILLHLALKSEASVLSEVQVYDADGKACVSLMMSRGMMLDDDATVQVYVAGEPKAPLSLALALSGGGPSVKLPLQVENVPVRNP